MSKFYTIQDANKLRFYQVPKVLVEGEKYSELGLAEKLTYGILLDRLQLSIKNNWCDEDGYIFFLFSGEKLGELLNVHEKTARKYIRNLIKFGLAEEKRMGRGLTNKLYLIQPEHIESDIRKSIHNEIEDLTREDLEKYEKEQKVPSEKDDIDLENYKKEQKVPSRSNERFLLEGTKSSPNDTDINDTDFNDNHSFSNEKNERTNDIKNNSTPKALNDILKNINFESIQEDRKLSINQAIRLLLFSNNNLKVNGMYVPAAQVREDLKLLNYFNVESGYNDFLNIARREEVKNPTRLLATCIYNAIFSSDLKIDAALALDGYK